MDLKAKIDDQSALVGVIGLGYVGLPLLRAFWDAGYRIIGFDIDPEKIRILQQGESYLKHLGDHFVKQMSNSDRFEATDDFARLSDPDAILICVPTPLDTHQQPDLSFVERAATDIAQTLRPQQLIVLESSTYPGTTRQVILPCLESGSMRCGKDFYLAYSPEREDPGNPVHHTRNIPKLVGGIDESSGKLAADLYRQTIDQVVPVRNSEVAEAAKLLENIYRAVNIALANEMKMVLSHMGVDVWEVIEAASTKPFGFQPFYPGPGLGGHCIPIDPFYLSWKARELGIPTRFIELAGEINRAMPDYVVQQTVLALNAQGKSIRDATVLVFGLAYKPNVDDIRESPSFELIEKLQSLGAAVDYSDPHVPTTHKMRHHNLKMSSVELSQEALKKYDCVLIATNHSSFDWQMIADHANLVVDSRNATKLVSGRRDHIFPT